MYVIKLLHDINLNFNFLIYKGKTHTIESGCRENSNHTVMRVSGRYDTIYIFTGNTKYKLSGGDREIM